MAYVRDIESGAHCVLKAALGLAALADAAPLPRRLQPSRSLCIVQLIRTGTVSPPDIFSFVLRTAILTFAKWHLQTRENEFVEGCCGL